MCKKLHLQRKILSFSAQNSHSVQIFADKIKPFSPPITPTHYTIYNTTSQLPLPETTTFVIVSRPPSNRIPSAAQSDSVRRPIGFRPPPDQIPYAVRPTSRIFSSPTHNTFTITSKPSQNSSIPSIPTFLAFNPLKPPILVDLSQIEPKNEVFLKLFCQNTCKVMIFVIPLHPLSRTN